MDSGKKYILMHNGKRFGIAYLKPTQRPAALTFERIYINDMSPVLGVLHPDDRTTFDMAVIENDKVIGFLRECIFHMASWRAAPEFHLTDAEIIPRRWEAVPQ